MLQGKVGEDQRATGRYRLRLANHIPRRCQLSELPSEALLQVAVVSARHAGRKDRITRPELQGEAAPAQDAFRPKPEACPDLPKPLVEQYAGRDQTQRAQLRPVHGGQGEPGLTTAGREGDDATVVPQFPGGQGRFLIGSELDIGPRLRGRAKRRSDILESDTAFEEPALEGGV